jgi:putative ABC transport system ATP-binding protein
VSEPAILLKGVSKRYPAREGAAAQDLLRGLDLEVRRGEFVAVEGQSGSGKSTLLHLLGGLDRDFEGEARVLGCDLRGMNDQGVPDAERRAGEALKRVGLADKAASPPAALSGGERQRVAIARALLARPPLLLADEPTGNLDAKTGAGVIALFHELHSEGMTLLIVTHEARISHAASRVIVLREGKLVAEETATHPLETE